MAFPEKTLPRQRLWLALILGGFTILATIFSIVTPIFEASDELWHYPMVKTIADNAALPVQDPANPGPWRQEGSQPPLYYMIGAAATFWIDTGDMDEVRRINPHADIGVVLPDRNVNMVVHDPDREAFPWSGTVLAIHIVRFLSILMGLGTVYLTYRLSLALLPDRPMLALAAAAFTAFNPMFIFISAVINNDNLSTLLATLILLLIVRLIREPHRTPTTRDYVVLGLATGAGMLAKYQIGFLLPIIALTLLAISVRQRDWRPVVVGGAIAGGLTILIAGWWYWRNYDLYGDATGINVFLDIVGRRSVPADLRQLWTERETFMMAFWGFFGGVNVPMRDSIYLLLNLLAGLAALGLITRLAQETWLRFRTRTCPPEKSLYQARAVAAAWAVIVFISLLAWTRQTWASQGRLWFSALAVLNIALAFGIANWARGAPRLQALNLGVAALVFVVAAVTAPIWSIHPAYTLDRDAAWDGSTLEGGAPQRACFNPPEAGADSASLCMTYRPISGALQPGDYLYLSPTFTTTGTFARNWSVFVHLVNPDGIIEAQRDVYPGQGLIATTDLDGPDTWRNLIAVEIPPATYTPQTLDVYLGFYHLPSGDRMAVSGEGADAATSRVHLGTIQLETPPGEVPNPVEINFDDTLRLEGYTISDRSLTPGQPVDVTLYWRGIPNRLAENYVVSVQIIDPDPARLTKIAQDDSPPDPPTTDAAWDDQARLTDTRRLTIAPDAAPGRYRLLVRVYPASNPGQPLRVRGDTGGQSEDFAWLSWIQVE